MCGRRGPYGWRVEVAELRTPGGAIHYLGLHPGKASQQPPAGWRGIAERASQGYWHRPVGELRAEAREQLRAEAVARHAKHELDFERQAMLARAAEEAWGAQRRSPC